MFIFDLELRIRDLIQLCYRCGANGSGNVGAPQDEARSPRLCVSDLWPMLQAEGAHKTSHERDAHETCPLRMPHLQKAIREQRL